MAEAGSDDADGDDEDCALTDEILDEHDAEHSSDDGRRRQRGGGDSNGRQGPPGH